MTVRVALLCLVPLPLFLPACAAPESGQSQPPAAARPTTPQQLASPADSVEIRALLAKAGEGDASAQASLGLRYGRGRGVPPDDAQAVT